MGQTLYLDGGRYCAGCRVRTKLKRCPECHRLTRGSACRSNATK